MTWRSFSSHAPLTDSSSRTITCPSISHDLVLMSPQDPILRQAQKLRIHPPLFGVPQGSSPPARLAILVPRHLVRIKIRLHKPQTRLQAGPAYRPCRPCYTQPIWRGTRASRRRHVSLCRGVRGRSTAAASIAACGRVAVDGCTIYHRRGDRGWLNRPRWCTQAHVPIITLPSTLPPLYRRASPGV